MTDAVYALLVDAYKDGTLIDLLNDHAAEARAAGRDSGYQEGLAAGITEGWTAAVEMFGNSPDTDTDEDTR